VLSFRTSQRVRDGAVLERDGGYVAGSRAPTTFCILSLMNTLSGCLLMGFVTVEPVTRRQIYCQYLCAPSVIPDAVEISHSDASGRATRALHARSFWNSEGDGRISTFGEQSAVSVVRYRMLRLSSSSSRVSSVLDETRRMRMPRDRRRKKIFALWANFEIHGRESNVLTRFAPA
jgi:hypothetical protein